MANEVAVNILLKAQDQTGAAITSATGNLGKMGKAAGVAWGLVGGAAASTALGILGDASRAAAEDEANVTKLKTALEASGASWEDNAAAVEARIKAGQNLAFTDTDVRDSIAQLTTATGDVNKAMEMQNLVMDIARGRNVSMATATDIAQKASLGQFGALKKMGIVLDEGSTATEALGELQKRYAKQADNYGQTTSAAIFKVKDSIDEWKEGLGAALGPAQGVLAMLPEMSSGMMIAGTAIGGISSLIKMTFIPSLIAMAVPFLPLILVIGAIGLAVALLAVAWSNNWGDIQGKTKIVIGFLQDLFDGFRVLVLLVFKGIVTGVAGFMNGIIGVINGFIEKYNALAGVLGLPIIGKIDLIVPNLAGVDAAINQIARDREARIFLSLPPGAGSATPGHGMYAEGTNYVPYTGLALVHQGEAIIPASQNRGGWGGPPIVNVTVNGSVIGGGIQELAREIGRVFMMQRRIARVYPERGN